MIESARDNRIVALVKEAAWLLVNKADDEKKGRGTVCESTVAAIRGIEAVLTTTAGGGCICMCPVIDGHTGNCAITPYLPSPVPAVETAHGHHDHLVALANAERDVRTKEILAAGEEMRDVLEDGAADSDRAFRALQRWLTLPEVRELLGAVE